MPRKILVIEDDKDIARLMEMHLRDMDCVVTLVHDGLRGLEKAHAESFDLIILDLMLPQLDGLELCRRLRQQDKYTPILMVTAKSSEIDRVLGLELGADDYLTKPFSIRELLARVKALFRRVDALQGASTPQTSQHQKVLRLGEMVIDLEKRKVTLQDKPVSLTAKEFDLLLQFASHPGRVYTRTQLLDSVWGYGYEGYEHTVNSHINRLRTKIEKDPTQPRYVLTVWGVGYKFAEPEDWQKP